MNHRNSRGSSDGDNALLPVETALTTLQPLRDLAKNWDIDIASCLEEYLQDLLNVLTPAEQERIKNNPNAATSAAAMSLNFSQAALVLQNSSNVYSRKVEYLYTLVYKTLEELSNKALQQQQQQQQPNNGKAGRAGGTSEDVQSFYNFDPNLDFFLMDDVIPVSDKINLQEKGAASTNAGNNNPNASMISSTSKWSLSNGTSTIGMNTTSGTFSSDSSSQQQLALLLATDSKTTAAGATLRLLDGQCDIGEGGVLLMPGTALSSQQQQQQPSSRRESSIATDPSQGRPSSESNDTNDPTQNDNTNKPTNTTAPENMDIDAGFGGNDDDYDDHDEGAGFVLNDDYGNNEDVDPLPPEATQDPQDMEEGKEPGQEIISQQQRQQQQQEKDSSNPKTVQFAENAHDKKKKKEKEDPWQLLDPHNATSSSKSSRPLKIGKTYKLPFGIRNLPSECVTGARTRKKDRQKRRRKQLLDRRKSLGRSFCGGGGDGGVVPLTSITFQASLANQRRLSLISANGHRRNTSLLDHGNDNSMISLDNDDDDDVLSNIPLNQLIFGDEFKYIAKETAKRRAAEKRQQQRSAAGPIPDNNPTADDGPNDNDEDDYQNMDFDFGGDDNDSYGDDGGGDGGPVLGNTGRLSIEGAFANVEGEDFDDLDNDAIDHTSPQQTFEDLCRAHIRAFVKGASRYATETNLTKRVGDWHQRLVPILEEEENRPVYDIHQYQKRVVTNIEQELFQQQQEQDDERGDLNKKTNTTVDFNAVTQDSEHYDVCRLFLASLSLCNSENVVFQTNGINHNNDKDLSSIGIQLLNNQIDRPTEQYNNDENDENSPN